MHYLSKSGIADMKMKLPEYLANMGININKPFICLNPAHDDENPSMSYEAKTNRVKCFSCGYGGDIFDILKLKHGELPFMELVKLCETDTQAVTQAKAHKAQVEAQAETQVNDTSSLKVTKKAQAEAYIEAHTETQAETQANHISSLKVIDKQETMPAMLSNYTDYYKKCSNNIKRTHYLQYRGISEEVISKYGIGYDPSWRHPNVPVTVPLSPRVIIPISPACYIARDTRDLSTLNSEQKKYVKQRVGEVQVYLLENLNIESSKPVYIVEGEVDALSVITAGSDAVAIGGVANTRKFIKAVTDSQTKRYLYIAMDNDAPGKQAAQKLSAELSKIGVKHRIVNPWCGYKDANALLMADKNMLTESIFKLNAIIESGGNESYKEHMRMSNRHALKNFIENLKKGADTEHIPTGFHRLDDELGGGLSEGLFIIGSISSIGKTTVLMQICDQIAAENFDVIIFHLEMSRNEIIANSLSRHTKLIAMDSGNKGAYPKSSRAISKSAYYAEYSNEEINLINNAVYEYGAYAGNLYIHESVGGVNVVKIRDIVKNHVIFTGRRPVVAIDYLQALAPVNDRMTDKQSVDRTVKELKLISREFKIPVIAISSFNRCNYNTPVSYESFKESGSVEYTASVLMALSFKGIGEPGFDVNAAKTADPREIELTILKNRHGKAWSKIDYQYYPQYYLFIEM